MSSEEQDRIAFLKSSRQDEIKKSRTTSKKDKTTGANQMLISKFLIKREVGAEEQSCRDTLRAHAVGAKSRKSETRTKVTPRKYPKNIAPSENTVSVPACLDRGGKVSNIIENIQSLGKPSKMKMKILELTPSKKRQFKFEFIRSRFAANPDEVSGNPSPKSEEFCDGSPAKRGRWS